MYLMNNSTALTTFVLDILKREKLLGNDCTVILTGSSSLECAKEHPNYKRYFNGSSDIDVFIVVNQDILFMKEIFSEYLFDSFHEDIINVLNFSYQYGIERNALNIKYVKKVTFIEWMNLKEIHFKSYRKHSLSNKKTYMKCYGLSDAIIIPYKEDAIEDHFILHYDIKFKEKYYLIDIHSMILFGTIILGTDLLSLIDYFNFFFKSLLSIPDEKLFNLFKYYLYEKKSIENSELRSFIQKFTELKIEKLFDILKEKKIIYEVKGCIKENAQLATICWARSDPKPVFSFMNRLSKCISNKSFILLVDDMCPKILYGRTDAEQKEMNQKYLNAFSDCKIYFSSDIFREVLSENFMEEFICMMKKIKLNYYIDFLPEKKRVEFANVKLGEFIHTFCELFLLAYGEEYLNIDTMIFGKFSQNVIFMSKQQTNKESKMGYIIISRLSEDDMESLVKIHKEVLT